MLELFKSLSTIELIAWGCYVSLFFFQLFYLLITYRKLLFYKTAPDKTIDTASLPPVSVIICAKNEASNLEHYLPRVLEQDYPEFQVVVVNDCSEDNSEEILEKLRNNYAHLYFTNVKSDPIYCHGKKLAVTLGIKAAKYEHLIFTDADCYPIDKMWLCSMAQHFSETKKIVLGISPYEQSKGLLGQVIGYETLQTAINYISSALRQQTYMGVGRNMGYTKSLFYDNKGFSGHTHLLSGDDDLFINKAATQDNVAVEISSNSIIKSIPEKRWNTWLKQKRRHLTTGKYYKKNQKFCFMVEGSVGFLFYCSFFLLLALLSYPLIVACVFILRTLIISSYRTIAARKMNFEKADFFQALWLDIIVPVVRAVVAFINMVKPQKFTWR